MNAATRMLIWSEWRQRRTQFVIAMTWLAVGVGYCIVYQLVSGLRAPVGSLSDTTMLFSMAMPLFVAMRTSLGEQTDRTRAFHDGLPVSSRKRAVVRLVGGLAVLVVPIVFAAVVMSIFLAAGCLEQALERAADYATTFVRLPDRPSMTANSAVLMVWRSTAISAASASTLYLLLSILGTAMRGESHLGFAGAVLTAMWLFVGLAMGAPEWRSFVWVGAILPQSLSVSYGYKIEQGMYGDLVFAKHITGPLRANIVVQLGLAALFVHRYCRQVSRRAAIKRRRTLPKIWRPWAMPLPTRWLALTWLTLRQCVPMCIPGLLLAILIAPFQMDATTFDPDTSTIQRVTDILPSSMWFTGLLWSMVVGAGVFAPELDSRIAEFWRAWPTGTWRLFTVKFVVGLTAVLLVLDGTTIAVSWNSPNWGNYYFMNWPYIACIVPLHATMFAVAVAFTCWVRRPVIGGMLAFAAFMLAMIAADWSSVTQQFDPITVYNNLNQQNRGLGGTLNPIDFTAHNYPAMAAAMAILFVGMAIAGWWALRSYVPRRAIG